MTKADKLLAALRANPRGDWQIADVERVCRLHGMICLPPKRGDHWKVAHPDLDEILTIPAHRPIDGVYIRRLVTMIDAVTK